MLEFNRSYLEKQYDFGYLEYLLQKGYVVYCEEVGCVCDNDGIIPSFVLDFSKDSRGGVDLVMRVLDEEMGIRACKYMKYMYGLDKSRVVRELVEGMGYWYWYRGLSYEEVDSIYVLLYMRPDVIEYCRDSDFIDMVYSLCGDIIVKRLCIPEDELKIINNTGNEVIIFVKDSVYMDKIRAILYRYLPESSYIIDEVSTAGVWKYRCRINLRDEEYVGIIHMMSTDML